MTSKTELEVGGYDLGDITVESQLEYADRLHRAARHAEAAQVLEGLCEAHPDNFEGHLAYGRLLWNLQKPEKAERHLLKAIEIDGSNAQPHLALSEIQAALGRLKETEERLQHALKLDPSLSDAYVKLALLAMKAGDKSRAIALCEDGLKIDPALTGAHQILGMLYRERGDLKTSSNHLLKTRQKSPPAPDPYCHLALDLFALGRAAELEGLPPPVSSSERFAALVIQAIQDWTNGAFEACGTKVEQGRGLLPHMSPGPLNRVFGTYFDILDGLLNHRNDHPEQYAGESTQQIYVMGDSHCLTFGHLTIDWSGKTSRLVPALVYGCKVWHLIQDGDNPYRAAFLATLDRLPKGAALLACFGELDCRLREGLFRHLQQNSGLDREETVSRTVAAYVPMIKEAAAARDMDLTLVSPPMSNLPPKRIPVEERAPYRDVIRTFNRCLREEAEKAGLPLIDLHAATSATDGVAVPEYYIDSNHVKPDAFLEALRLFSESRPQILQ